VKKKRVKGTEAQSKKLCWVLSEKEKGQRHKAKEYEQLSHPPR
jgi:hypothetical protein